MRNVLVFFLNLLIGIISWPFVVVLGAIALILWPLLWAINGWDEEIE